MLWIIVIAAVAYFLYHRAKKRNEAETLARLIETMAHSQAMEDAMNMLTDISHLTVPCMCTFEVNPGHYACEIDSSIEIIGIMDNCSPIISNYELYRSQKIADSIAGKISRSQCSNDVGEYEKTTDEALAVILLQSYAPQSYLFLHLREFLKPSSNSDMKINYPIVLGVDMRDQRPTFLKILAEKGPAAFSNCKVYSLDALSLTLKFYPK